MLEQSHIEVGAAGVGKDLPSKSPKGQSAGRGDGSRVILRRPEISRGAAGETVGIAHHVDVRCKVGKSVGYPALSDGTEPAPPLSTLKGTPLWMVVMPDHCHPPRILPFKSLPLKNGKSSTSLEMLHKADGLAPQVAGIRLNIGLVHYRQEGYPAAIPAFEFVVREVPGFSASPIFIRAMLFLHGALSGGGSYTGTARGSNNPGS